MKHDYTTATTIHRLRPALVVIAVALVGLATWLIAGNDDTSPVYGAASTRAYDSIEALTTEADVVVIGSVTDVAAREIDFGTANIDERVGETGVPVVFYEIAVEETLKGASAKTIIVGSLDGEALASPSVTPLRRGEQVLLFLAHQVAAEDSPGVTLFDTYYTPLSLDNGVFDILATGEARPRAPRFFVTGSEPIELNELRQKVAEQ